MTARAISTKLTPPSSKLLPNRILFPPLHLRLSHSIPPPRPKQPHQPQHQPQRPLPTGTRTISTTTHLLSERKPPSATPLSPSAYHTLSDSYIDSLVSQLEEIQEARQDVDVEYSAGVLTLHFPPNGTYVLNKQPPNRQIWLSSPVSGPKRYDWVVADSDSDSDSDLEKENGAKGQWVYLRDGSTLSGLLGEEVGVEVREGEGE